MTTYQLTRLKINHKGMRTILRGDQDHRIRDDLMERGERVADRANGGTGVRLAKGAKYFAEGWVGRNRYRVNVSSDQLVTVSTSPLLPAVDAARGTV